MRLEVIPGKGKTDQRRVVPIRRNEVKLEEQAAQKEVIEFTDEADQVHRIGVIDIPPFISILRLIAMATKLSLHNPGCAEAD
ncbi:MAG: hypothetical protein CM15mP84_08080 [Cellvibrionales bacterium]|nr:MAG: hypothetical protein CM15mP84_08080 [Cellvibrionales bacterium]